MIGLDQAKRRQPPKLKKTTREEIKAARQIAMVQLRAEAAQGRALALALLASTYAQKLAAARTSYQGDELAAAIAAIMAEQRAAERALSGKLAGEAQARRQAVAQQFSEQSRGDSVRRGFRRAAVETAARGTSPSRGRPRERARGSRAPRLKR